MREAERVGGSGGGRRVGLDGGGIGRRARDVKGEGRGMKGKGRGGGRGRIGEETGEGDK